MTAHSVFILSMLIGWAGVVGFVWEHVQGRMGLYTTWDELTNRQWLFVYMMIQFVAALVVGGMYLIFRSFA